jgi:hypothetical protein
LIALAAILGASTISAAAADLGGLAVGQLYAYGTEVTIDLPDPPITLASDDFAGCHNTLDGWEDSLGNEWADHWGRWQCLGGEVVRSQSRLPLAHASLDIGRSDDIVITADVADISNQNNRSGPGIALSTDGFFHMYVVYERDQGRVTLGKSSPWANTSLQSVPVSDRDSAVISVIVDQPSLTVLIDGNVVMTYDLGQLTAAEEDYFLSQTRFGLESDNDNQSRFDSFLIETLP